MSIRYLAADDPPEAFPDVEHALEDPDGLLAVGGDLSLARLRYAYRHGIFPWYEQGQPILWWCPNPRTVLFPEQVHVSRRLARTIRQRRFHLTADRAFNDVMLACAQPRAYSDATWITTGMRQAYAALHREGIAHSIEAWRQDQLVGGLHGIALGKVFFGESMFSRERDASKVALAATARLLADMGFELIDCQVFSEHLARMGAVQIQRADFIDRLAELCDGPESATDWASQLAGRTP